MKYTFLSILIVFCLSCSNESGKKEVKQESVEVTKQKKVMTDKERDEEFKIAMSIFPLTVKQEEVINDTNIINDSKLKVIKLFDNSNDFKLRSLMNNSMDQLYFKNVYFCEGVIIELSAYSFRIEGGNTIVRYRDSSKCTNKIPHTYFYKNSKIKKDKKTGKEILVYNYDIQKIKTELGRIEVSQKDPICCETGKNPFKIKTIDGEIDFKNVGNLNVFEYDGDMSGKKEIYIVNTFDSEIIIKLYKITDK
jgi:hypothetical protein